MEYKFEGSKGEWEIVSEDTQHSGMAVDTIRVKEWEHNHMMGDYKGCIICSFSEAHGKRKHAFAEATANAHLIASAPALLQACIEAQIVLETVINATPNGDLRNRLTELNIKALTAIHKSLNLKP